MDEAAISSDCSLSTVVLLALLLDAVSGRHFLLIYDPFSYSYPLRTIAWESIRSGVLPIWTPFILSGYPLLSMAQLGLGYPLTWGYLFLPGHWAEQFYILAPFLLSSLFTYVYARAIKRTRTASLLAGLSFAYGGMMAGALSNGMLPNAVMWLPLILTAIEKSRHSSLLHCWVTATCAYAMSVLTGIGQGFLYVGIVVLAYAFCLAFVCADAQQKFRQRWRPLLVAGGMIVGALGLAAFQILETAQAVRLSVRQQLSYEFFSGLAYAPRAAFKALLAPPYYAIESSPYLTPVTLLLATVAVVVTLSSLFQRKQRNARQLFWILVAVFSWFAMLGAHTPLLQTAVSDSGREYVSWRVTSFLRMDIRAEHPGSLRLGRRSTEAARECCSQRFEAEAAFYFATALVVVLHRRGLVAMGEKQIWPLRYRGSLFDLEIYFHAGDAELALASVATACIISQKMADAGDSCAQLFCRAVHPVFALVGANQQYSREPHHSGAGSLPLVCSSFARKKIVSMSAQPCLLNKLRPDRNSMRPILPPCAGFTIWRVMNHCNSNVITAHSVLFGWTA
jgi:hypothetical protein